MNYIDNYYKNKILKYLEIVWDDFFSFFAIGCITGIIALIFYSLRSFSFFHDAYDNSMTRFIDQIDDPNIVIFIIVCFVGFFFFEKIKDNSRYVWLLKIIEKIHNKLSEFCSAACSLLIGFSISIFINRIFSDKIDNIIILIGILISAFIIFILPIIVLVLPAWFYSVVRFVIKKF